MVYRQTERTMERNALRRKQILTAARKMFSAYGYEKTTMNRIVKKAGTSIGNCYYYFPDKEALLMEIIKDIIDQIWCIADDTAEAISSGVQKLANILYESAVIMMENEETARLMIIGQSVAPVRRTMFEIFRKRIQKLVNDNPSLNRSGNIELELYAVHGAIMGFLDRMRSGDIRCQPHEIGIYLTRWNLQALDFPREDIEASLRSLESLAGRKKQAGKYQK